MLRHRKVFNIVENCLAPLHPWTAAPSNDDIKACGQYPLNLCLTKFTTYKYRHRIFIRTMFLFEIAYEFFNLLYNYVCTYASYSMVESFSLKYFSKLSDDIQAVKQAVGNVDLVQDVQHNRYHLPTKVQMYMV